MRILLAEDEKQLRDPLKIMLEQNHFSVDAVANGREAMDLLEYGAAYDCLVLDIMMPIMDGIAVIKEIKEKEIQVPILVLTAKGEVDDRVYGLDIGADDYLVKPFSSKELFARIRALTRRPLTTTNANLTFGNLTLNRTAFQVESQSGSLVLPNKEFQLLELFMLNPHIIISFDAIFERIWGLESDADQSTFWVTLSNLRKKLTQLKSDIMIKSTRNVGYSLERRDD